MDTVDLCKNVQEGLAYEKSSRSTGALPVRQVLQNEEVVNGCCERCGTPVTKKNLRQ